MLTAHVDGELLLRVDTAEHEIRAGFRERDLDRFARLLRAGIEIELVVEYADVVGARIVVEEPQSLAAADPNTRRREGLVVLRDRGDAFGRTGCDASATMPAGSCGSPSLVSVSRKATSAACSPAERSILRRSGERVARSAMPPT